MNFEQKAVFNIISSFFKLDFLLKLKLARVSVLAAIHEVIPCVWSDSVIRNYCTICKNHVLAKLPSGSPMCQGMQAHLPLFLNFLNNNNNNSSDFCSAF